MPAVSEYVALVPSANRDQPKFRAVLEGLLAPLVGTQGFLARAQTIYDLDTATGAQLDAVGEHVGQDRNIELPKTDVFFSFNVEGLGWNQGIWKGPYDEGNGITRLDDDTYRLVLKMKVAANNWDGTIGHAAEILGTLFNDPETFVFLEDGQDMSMTLNISGKRLNALFLALLKEGYAPMKPAGVRLSGVKTNTVNRTALFGWNMDTPEVAGWNIGSWSKEA